MKTSTAPARFNDRPFEIEGHGLRWRVVNMRPELAQQFLAKMHPKQRREKPVKIARFARLMAAGRWLLTHQGIGVDEDGWTVDGQNRLKAVVRSGACVPMVVCYGVPRQSATAMDNGTPRNVNDHAGFAGVAMDNRQFASVARRMAAGLSGQDDLTVEEVLDWVGTYADGLRFAFSNFGKGNTSGVLVASTRAVLARAYYSANKGRLRQFGEILVSGLPDNPRTDAACILLRNWLLEAATPGKRRSQGGRTDRRLTYSFTEFCLDHFLKSSRPVQLLEVAEEKFPLPDLESFDKKG